ncbi:Huntingtin [Geodia barretti]|nr:Huntingtin [Geodia barretti]
MALTSVSFPLSLTSAFLSLTPSYPLLTLHYYHLSLLTGGRSLVFSALQVCSASQAPSHRLLYHCLLPLLSCSGTSLMDTVPTTLIDRDRTTEKDTLIEQLMNSDFSNPVACMHALQLARDEGSVRVLPLLCRRLVTHPFSSISSPAASLAGRIMADKKVSSDLARELLPFLSGAGNRYPELLSTTQRLADVPSPAPPQSSSSHPLQFTSQVQAVTRLWFLAEVHDLCRNSCSDWLCGRVLARLSLSELSDLLQNPDIPKGLLEACVSHGLEVSLSSSSQTPHPLLQASSARLLDQLVQSQGPGDPSLLPPLLWLLLAQEVLSLPPLNEAAVSSVLAAITGGLQQRDSTLLLQTSMDCLSLALSLREIQSGIDDAWLATTVPLVVALAKGSTAEAGKADGSSSQQLHSALTHSPTHSLSPSLRLHTGTALLSLARLPSLHATCLIPPLLLSPGSQSPSEQVLDQALLEGEVLQQYMARSNTVGWLDRAQFEERWMQLLGVVNQPPPAEGMPVEEMYAHTLNMCIGLVGVVSLLLATSLCPQPGNPVFGVPLHTHRNRDILFLGTKPGRRLRKVRSVVETQLLLQCGARPDIYSHYQCPLLSHLSLPLFTRNVERGPGGTELGPAQLSLKSLWPVTLANPTSPARHSPDGVDVRSCVLSLVDLFSHWLGQPLHPLLLLHTLRAILMLSDLFSLPSQFQWMLELACDLSDKQPPEDVALHAILMQCILKAGAVLKVDAVQLERIVRSTERALSSDSLEVQDGCLCGLLYVVEDPGSQLAAHLAAPLAKYLPPQLESFHRLSEQHCTLCWSLAVSLALHHSHLLKDAEFPGQLLEKAIPLFLHPHTSPLLFHSLCFGLELLVLNFTLSNEQRSKVTNVTAGRCAKCELDKVLPALGLLLSCMYSGEQGNYVNEDEETEAAVEMSVLTREYVGILVEHLRHSPLEGVRFLVGVVPVVMVDFLPPVQVLQMVVTEFVSPHQPRPSLAAIVMGETFSLVLGKNMGDTLTDCGPTVSGQFRSTGAREKGSLVFSVLLAAASSSSILRAMLEVVADQPNMCLHICKFSLATTSFYFCSNPSVKPSSKRCL